MIELPLALSAGLIGSSHCLGMCGPFALTIGTASTSPTNNLLRQLSYSSGRIIAYASIGSILGFCGHELIRRSAGFSYLPALFTVLAGSLLLYQGLLGAGIIRRKLHSASGFPCLAAHGVTSILTTSGSIAPFLAGVLTAFLPCGLLYGMLTLAAGTGSFISGGMVMMAFGIGTVPLMLMTGWGGAKLTVAFRRKLYHVAAWCVVVTGAITIVRGTMFLLPGSANVEGACPFCNSASLK